MQSTQWPSWATGSAAGADADGFIPSASADGGLLSTGLRLRNSRSSDGTGGSSDDTVPLSGTGSYISSTGGSSGSNVSLSGVVTAVQRGVSRAGRSVSGAMARLSIPGMRGYEQLVNTVNPTQPGLPDGSSVGTAGFTVQRQQQQQFEEVELQSTSGYRQSLAAQGQRRQWEQTEALGENGDATEMDGFFLPVSVDPHVQSAAFARAHSPSSLLPSAQSIGGGVISTSSSGGAGGQVRDQAGLSTAPSPAAAALRTQAAAGNSIPRSSRLIFSSSAGGSASPTGDRNDRRDSYLAAPDAAQGAGRSLQSALSAQAAAPASTTVPAAGSPTGAQDRPLRVALPPPPHTSTASPTSMRQ